MDITTFMGLLKFALLGIDLLAWPVLALGYPLFASIRAVETGCNYNMRKLVIYWTLFSLFSLFEFAFVKIIEWIPFWSSVRLAVIFCLVMPQFEGACLAYQALVLPVLLKLKDDGVSKRETFLNGLEKDIKDYGSEALEKHIALEHDSEKCIDFQRDTKIIKPEGGNTAATSDQVRCEQSMSSSQVLNGTYAVTNVIEMTPPEANVEIRRPETPPHEKNQQEWTCDLCKVTTKSESTLKAHLQGSKHKSKLESLKASLLDAKDAGPSPSVQHSQSVTAAWDLKGTYAAAEVKERVPPKETAEKRRQETPLLRKAQQEWTCDLCKVTTTSEITLNGHLQGSKHKSQLEKFIIEEIGFQKLFPSMVQYANAEVKETKQPEANRAKTPPLKKAQQKWSCDICEAKGTTEKTLIAHLEGRTHKAEFQSLKMSTLPTKCTRLSRAEMCKAKESNLVGKVFKDGIHWCFICELKLSSEFDAASHFKGKRHSSNMEIMEKVEAMIS